MRDNISKKIKAAAKVVFCLGGMIVCLAGGLIHENMTASKPNEEQIQTGVFVLLGGSLFSLSGGVIAYGIGELIEKTTAINNNIIKRAIPVHVAQPINQQRSECRECGTHNLLNDAFCANCGADLKSV
jgi:hypothetical protein